jgi:phosphoesterase RecJ-like protein
MALPITSALTAHRRLAVFSHIRPDGDAIGSQIAFCHWLSLHGVESLAFNDDPIPYNLKWLADDYLIQTPSQQLLDTCDGIVLLDGNKPDRFGMMADSITKADVPVYLIDHHPDPSDMFAEVLWDVRSSSTAELVYRLYLDTGIQSISRLAAIALYTGMVTDTGSFRFDSVSPATHLATADLLERGDFKPNIVHERVYDQKTASQYALLGLALSSMQFFAEGRIGIICVTESMFKQTGTSYQDTDSFVSYPMSVKGVEAAVIFVEHKGRVKLSFRSKTKLDVNQWAQQFEGGGHAKAAGGWTDAPLNDAITRVLVTGVRALSDLTIA